MMTSAPHALETWLEKKKMSKFEFAKKIDASPQAVWRYCRGQRIPRPEIMQRIMEVTRNQVTSKDFYENHRK